MGVDEMSQERVVVEERLTFVFLCTHRGFGQPYDGSDGKELLATIFR